MLPSRIVAPALALLEAEGYARGGGGPGTYTSEEEPMYRDGVYLADLCVCEDPARPVIDRLHAMLTPDRPPPPPTPAAGSSSAPGRPSVGAARVGERGVGRGGRSRRLAARRAMV